MKKDPVNFDDYANEYEEILKDQLSFFSKDRGYFSEYKVALAKKYCGKYVSKILDFGSGIGLSIPYLRSYFPFSELYATDISPASLKHLAGKYEYVKICEDSSLELYKFDLIFVACVFHHVSVSERVNLLYRLSNLLTPTGKIVIFEHNPYNLITQRMVSMCPFDRDAILLNLKEMEMLILRTKEIEIFSKGYCLFFPYILRKLNLFENLIRKIPLGGQYYIVCQKIK